MHRIQGTALLGNCPGVIHQWGGCIKLITLLFVYQQIFHKN